MTKLKSRPKAKLKLKLVKFSKMFYRIVNAETGKMIIGITQLANDKWRLIKFENGTEKAYGKSFDDPQSAFDHFKEKEA